LTRSLVRTAGAFLLTIAFAVAAPAAAHAQTAPWNDPTYGAAIPAHPDWIPYVTSHANDVSTDDVDRASLARDGDAERVALPYAQEWYTANVAPVDPANTFAIGDDETTLTASSPTSRTWNTWVTIYTIGHPTKGYRYCEFNYTVTATLEGDAWTTSATPVQRACRRLTTYGPTDPAPFGNLLTTVVPSGGGNAPMSRWSAELGVRNTAFAAWDTPEHDGFFTSGAVNFSTKLDDDSWYVIFTMYQRDTRTYCIDGYTVDWDLAELSRPPVVKGSGAAGCGSY
jgi:hypothetical protein